MGWVAEPDPDGGDIDGAAVDEVALVVAGGHGAGLVQVVDGAFDDVALLVGGAVEGGWAAAAGPVLDLVVGFGDGRRDVASSQVGADRPAGVGLVGQHAPRADTRLTAATAGDPQPGHHRLEAQAVVALPATGYPGQRAAAGVS